MKNLKRSSLVFAFLLYSLILAVVSMSFGINTEHNRALWYSLSNSEHLKPVPKSEQVPMYLEMKRSFALSNQGDK